MISVDSETNGERTIAINGVIGCCGYPGNWPVPFTSMPLLRYWMSDAELTQPICFMKAVADADSSGGTCELLRMCILVVG